MMNLSKQLITGAMVALICTGAMAQEAPKVKVVDPYAGNTPPPEAAAKKKPTSDVEYVSYLLGRNMGVVLRQQAMPINLQWLVNGIVDAFGNRSRLSQEELQKARQLHDQLVKSKAQAMQKLKTASEAYLAENKKKDGVVTTASGLQYQVFEAGKGPKPGAKDELTIKYAGRLIGGKEFLKSAEMKLTLGVVSVNGLRQGLAMMNAGAKWQMTIPPQLGYGATVSNNVPPYSVLIVDVEMISIQPAPTAGDSAAPSSQPGK